MRATILLALATILALGGCGDRGGSDNSASDANTISEDPYGATGAPGADMTDNGVTDGASGVADGNQAGGNVAAGGNLSANGAPRPVEDGAEGNAAVEAGIARGNGF
jgi:hypothetical protein